MTILFKNWQLIPLASGIDADDTSCSVSLGYGEQLGDIPAGDHYIATLTNSFEMSAAKKEIVSITARDTDSLTIARAQEGTTGQAFSAGDYIVLDFTAGTFEALAQETGDGGDIVRTESEQTMTNKRLTAPKLNGDVALTQTATQLNATKTEAEIDSKDDAVRTETTQLLIKHGLI